MFYVKIPHMYTACTYSCRNIQTGRDLSSLGLVSRLQFLLWSTWQLLTLELRQEFHFLFYWYNYEFLLEVFEFFLLHFTHFSFKNLILIYLGSLSITKYKALVSHFYTIETGVQGCNHLTGVLSGEGVSTLLHCKSSLSSQIAGAHWKVT